MLTKSQLRDVFVRYDFRPLKKLGENYLIDGNIKDKIISEIRPSRNDVILEIGPGFGALTADLAGSGARVLAVEKDRKAAAILKEMCGEDYPNLDIFNEDILKFDFEALKIYGRKIKVAGNLPYYVTTPIIERLIENKDLIESAVVMVQKEVGLRLSAVRPGTKDYGALSCFVQYHMKPVYVYTVKRNCFYPAPEVDSSLMRLDVLARPSVEVTDEKLLFKIIRGSFNQRRKSIINSLSREDVLSLPKERLSAVLSGIGIDPSARPESLTLRDFARIANSLTS